MIYTFTANNFKITDALSSKIKEEMSFLNKYFIVDDSTEAHVNVTLEGRTHKIELTVFTKAGVMRCEEKNYNLNKALEVAVNKLEKQICKNKERLNRRRKAALAEAFIDEQSVLSKADVAVRTKTISPQALELEEAILQMEMLGHSFFIYLDQETEHYAVVYQRDDGGYGLIEIEEQ